MIVAVNFSERKGLESMLGGSQLLGAVVRGRRSNVEPDLALGLVEEEEAGTTPC